MNNKIYSMLLISALIIGANAVNNSAIGSEEFPELLPTSAVDVRRMMNIECKDSIEIFVDGQYIMLKKDKKS